MFIIISLIVIIIFLCQLHLKFNQHDNIPCYVGLPLVGVVPFISLKHPFTTFARWRSQLGAIYSIRMGTQKFVVLNDHESLKKLFIEQRKWSSGREYIKIYSKNFRGNGMLFNSKCDKVKKTLIKLMKNVGHLKVVEEEMKHLVDYLEENEGKSINVKCFTMSATANVIFKILLNKRWKYDNANFMEIKMLITNMLNHPQDTYYIIAMVFCYHLRFLPIFNQVYKRLATTIGRLHDIFDEFIFDRRNVIMNDECKCVIDRLLMLRKKGELPYHLTKEDVNQLILEMTAAGSNSSSVTLQWCLLYLAHNQDIQKVLAKEIRSTSEEETMKNMNTATPLTRSFINEISRHKTFAPMGNLHKVTKTFKVDQKIFHKNTTIIPNYYAAHHDPTIFPDPYRIKIDRFVDTDTGQFLKSKYLIPFGVGPRSCPGYKMAEFELYLFLCGMLRYFTFHEDPLHPLPSFESGICNFIYSPHPFQLQIKRNHFS